MATTEDDALQLNIRRLHTFMKSTLFDLARKWFVGVCLLLWCWLIYLLMGVPAILLLLLSYLGVPGSVLTVLIGAYIVICVPLIAYHFAGHSDLITLRLEHLRRRAEYDHAD